jgi:threonyl-tRNA synthetase
MVQITLPSNDKLDFEGPISGLAIAERISKSLAKASVAIEVDGKIKDLSFEITNDSKVSIIKGDSKEGLEIIRHSSAHLLAQAVKRVYPKVQVTIGLLLKMVFSMILQKMSHLLQKI